MLKRDILSKKGKQITLLRSVIMSKSAFFAEIVFFSGMGHLLIYLYFLLKPAGRTEVFQRNVANSCFNNINLSDDITWAFFACSDELILNYTNLHLIIMINYNPLPISQ